MTKNFDRENFLYDYLDIDWEANKNNANTSLQAFLTEINQLLDKYMPLRKLTNKEYKRRFKPWISDTVLDKISKKNKAFRKFTNCKNPLTKEHLNEEYKSIKNELTTLTRQSKKDYYNQYFTDNTKNLKKSDKALKK